MLTACGGGGGGDIASSASSIISSASAQSAPVQEFPAQPTMNRGSLWYSHAELTNGLHVTGSMNASTYEWESVYTVTVRNVQPGDVVHCTAQAEATNNLSYNAQLDAAIAIGNWSGSAWPTFVNGVVAGTDISHDIHHGRVNIDVYDESPRNGDVTYSLVLQSASTSAATGDAITVNQGDGYLQCSVMHVAES